MNTIRGMIPCQTVRYASLATGAAVAYTGMDTYFAKMGAPKAAHYALAGLAPEMIKRWQDGNINHLPMDYEGLCAAGYGYMGAMALPMLTDLARKIGLRL
tara:strand:- start:439 stop:738 length:300 start_codon:yes stop_codon:yes gene_type:complete